MALASDLAQDGTVIWTTLAQPAEGLARAVARRRVLAVLLLATGLSLLAAALILPTVDPEAVAASSLRPDMTPHERGKAIDTATRLYHVTTWGRATVGPLIGAFFLAVALYFAFWVAGARTGFRAVFTVAAHALVPQALRALLLAPAAMVNRPVTPQDLDGLLPSSLAAVLPASVAPAALAAATALDVFTLWTVYLAGSGMARASGASRLRAGVVMVVLFAGYVAFFKIAPASGGS